MNPNESKGIIDERMFTTVLGTVKCSDNKDNTVTERKMEIWGKRKKKEKILITIINDKEIGKGQTDGM